MEVEALFRAFINAVKSNKSEKTAQQYRRYLRPFIKRVGVLDTKDITTKYVAGFMLSFYQTPSTKRAFASAYRKFREFAAEIYQLNLPDIPRDYVPKQNPKEPKPLTREEFEKLYSEIMKLPDVEEDDCKNLSFKCAFLLTAFGGLRVSEALSVFPNDVTERNGILYVRVRRGKGNKERIVPITTEKAKKFLKAHIDDLPPTLNRSTFFKRLRKIGKKIGIRNLHPHRLRDTFLTILADNGTPIQVLQDIAGHSSIEMTRKYVKVSLSRIEEAVAKAF